LFSPGRGLTAATAAKPGSNLACEDNNRLSAANSK